MTSIWVAVGLSSLPALGADEPAQSDDAATPPSAEAAAEPATAVPTPGAVVPVPTPAMPTPVEVIPTPGSGLPAAGGAIPGSPQPGLPELPGTSPTPGVLPGDAVSPGASDPLVPGDGMPAPLEVPRGPGGVIERIGELPEVALGFGDRPTGFSNRAGDFSLASRLLENPLQGFNFSASLLGTYDSSPTQGYGGPNQSSDGDFFATLGGSIAYHTTGEELTFGASYNGSYDQYFDQSDLSGFNQSAGVSASYRGGPLTARLNVGFSVNDGANRYYEDVVKQYSFNYALSADYRLSAKTSFMANLGQTLTDANGSYSSTGSFDAGLTALWHYSERTSFGPGIRYSSDSGESDNFRTTIGPTVSFNYRVSGKISLNSQLGVDFVNYDVGDEDDTSLFASIGLNYRASELWGMTFSIYRDGQANPTLDNGTQEITNFSLGYYRRIRQATWSLGVNYEMGSAGTEADPTGGSVDNDYFSFNTGLSMPVFADTCAARVFMSWSENSGGRVNSDGSFQLGAGLTWSF